MCIFPNGHIQGLIIDAPGYTSKVLVAFGGKVEWLDEACLEKIDVDKVKKH